MKAHTELQILPMLPAGRMQTVWSGRMQMQTERKAETSRMVEGPKLQKKREVKGNKKRYLTHLYEKSEQIKIVIAEFQKWGNLRKALKIVIVFLGE